MIRPVSRDGNRTATLCNSSITTRQSGTPVLCARIGRVPMSYFADALWCLASPSIFSAASAVRLCIEVNSQRCGVVRGVYLLTQRRAR
jgi:hypothetical protein